MRDSLVEHRTIGRTPRALGVAGVAAIAGIVGWWLATDARAADTIVASPASVALESTDDGTSTELDAIEVELLSFGDAQAAFEALDATSSATLPTTIGGLTGVDLTGVVVEVRPADATIGITGTADDIFHLGDVAIAVLIDWDETDPTDSSPRVVVSARTDAGELAGLIGADDGSAVAAMGLDAGAITVSNRTDASTPTIGEVLLDTEGFTTSVAAHFEPVLGSPLPEGLALRGPVNLHAAARVGSADPTVAVGFGLDPAAVVFLAGSVDIEPADYPGAPATLLDAIDLRSTLAAVVLPNEVGSMLSLDNSTPIGTLSVARTDNGTTATGDDTLGVGWSAPAVLAAPLPSAPAIVHATVRDFGGGDVSVDFAADVGSWPTPFGLPWLTVSDTALVGSTSKTPGGGTVTTATLRGRTTIAGVDATVRTIGALDDPLAATMTLSATGPAAVADILGTTGANIDSIVPAALRSTLVSGLEVSIDVTGTLADPTVTVSSSGSIDFFPTTTPVTPMAAAFFAHHEVGEEPSGIVAIRPRGELMLSDVVAGATPDLELVSDDSDLVYLFAGAAITAPRVDQLDPRLAAVLQPLVGDDLSAPVDVDAGFSVQGQIGLPDALGTFARDALGLHPTAFVRGQIPFGSLTLLDLALSLKVDPSAQPEWIHDQTITLAVTAKVPSGIDIDLTGSLTAKIRAGLDADVAATMASLGVTVFSDLPVASSFDGCPGSSEVLPQRIGATIEYRCYDLITFAATASLEAQPPPSPSIGAELVLELDAAVMGADHAWQPFGLEWLEVRNAALLVKVSAAPPASTTPPPPGSPPQPKPKPNVTLEIGLRGEVAIGGTDLFISGKIKVDPNGKPPLSLQGFRLASDAGFAISDFFDLQHDIAVSAARAAGIDPATLPAALDPANLGVPDVALRNVEVSFAKSPDTDLCIPFGLYISADVYVDPTGEPAPRGDKCDGSGVPTTPPPGSTCAENADNGCLAGVRIALAATGFRALGDINGFELGPIVFNDARLDLALTTSEQHLILAGGASIDPVGSANLALSLRNDNGAVVADFAGKVTIGSAADPLLVALADGQAQFDPDAIGANGLRLRVVLDASNQSLAGAAADFAAEASASVDAAAADVIAALDELSGAVTAFRSDPPAFLNTGLADLGVVIPPEAQPLVDGVADLLGEAFSASEAAILRGELPGLPAIGQPTGLGCADLRTLFAGRCYDVGRLPDTIGFPGGGLQPDLCNQQAFDVYSSGRCYRSFGLPDADGTPNGGLDPVCELFLYPYSNGRCYEDTGFPDPTGTPSGDPVILSCPIPQGLSGGRCWDTVPSAGTPAGGVDRVRDIFGNLACPLYAPQWNGSKCYTFLPVAGSPAGGRDPIVSCPLFQVLVNGTCYASANVPDADGTPNGGRAKVCPVGTTLNGNAKCYETNGEPDADGTPNGGYTPGCGAPLVMYDQRCYITPPDPDGFPDGGLNPIPACTDLLYPFLSGGGCYTVPPIDVPGLCDVFGLSPTCSVEDVIDQVVKPVVIDAAGFTADAFDTVAGILDDIDQLFALECASFELVLNGVQQSAEVSVTMRVGGVSRTFMLGWDLSQDLASNLTGVLDGLEGAASTGCVPPDYAPFAADLFGNDGGPLFNPVVAVPDSYEVAEGETRRVDPLVNDLLADQATITSVVVTGGGAGSLTATLDDDNRGIFLVGGGPLLPDQTVGYLVSYDAVNESGETTTGAVPVTVRGRNDAPVAVADVAGFDLRTQPGVTIDVLANDTDAEDGTPVALAGVVPSADGGCATVAGNDMSLVALRCDDTASAYTELGEAETLVDTIVYSALDSAGASGDGIVDVTVTGANDPPIIDSVETSTATATVASEVQLTASFGDPDTTDDHTASVDWGDGTTSVVSVLPGDRTLATSHVYGAGGRRTITVTIDDGTVVSAPSVVKLTITDLAVAPPGCDTCVAWPDFDGDGDADRSIFRAEFGGWYVDGQPTAFIGLAEDVPVPADYDGDGTSDRAVFRNGTWYIEGAAPVYLGAAGDVPVPADYDGDGTADAAVYRNGVWYIDGQPTQFFGTATDIPVPGDYNGDGITEVAVYRPDVGGWYVNGQAPEFYGLATDIPVPADYNGDGTTDRAVYRPQFGGWYVQGQDPVFVGLSTDVPVPADYDGDGDADHAVYRPDSGGWYVDGQPTSFYGLSTDVPLPLPAAIYSTIVATS